MSRKPTMDHPADGLERIKRDPRKGGGVDDSAGFRSTLAELLSAADPPCGCCPQQAAKYHQRGGVARAVMSALDEPPEGWFHTVERCPRSGHFRTPRGGWRAP